MIPVKPHKPAALIGQSSSDSVSFSSLDTATSNIASNAIEANTVKKSPNLRAKNISLSSSLSIPSVGSSSKKNEDLLHFDEASSSASKMSASDETSEELYNTPPEQMLFIIQQILIRKSRKEVKTSSLFMQMSENDLRANLSSHIDKTFENFLKDSPYGCGLLSLFYQQLAQLDQNQKYTQALSRVIKEWATALFSDQPTERVRICKLRVLIIQFEEENSKKLKKEQIPDILEKFISHVNRLYYLVDEFEDIVGFFALKELSHPLHFIWNHISIWKEVDR